MPLIETQNEVVSFPALERSLRLHEIKLELNRMDSKGWVNLTKEEVEKHQRLFKEMKELESF